MILTFFSFAFPVILAAARESHQLLPRAQIAATCEAGFQWAFNSKDHSPCLVAAQVLGSCTNGQWNVQALSDGNRYVPPNTTTVNACQCSWVAYNLLGACTACQGFEDFINNWSLYTQICQPSNLLAKTFFPSNIALPDDTALPFWSLTDPTQWKDQRFDVSQAKTLADENKPDVNPTTNPPKKKAPVGAIVGGVIGGVAALLITAGIAFYLLRKGRDGNRGQSTAILNSHTSDRSTSEFSRGFRSVNYMPLTPKTNQLSPTSMHTHNSSAHSLSYFSTGSGGMTTPPPTSFSVRQMSPPPPSQPQLPNREDLIVPFTLSHRQSDSHLRRPDKATDGVFHPTYDNPNALPHSATLDNSIIHTSPPRARVNPPAYPGPSTGAAGTPGPSRPPHSKIPSLDSSESSVSMSVWNSGGQTNLAGVAAQMNIGGSGPSDVPDTSLQGTSMLENRKRQPVVNHQENRISDHERDIA